MDFQNIADMFLVNKNNHRPMAKGDAGHMKKYVSAYEQGTYLMLEFEKVDSVTGDLSLVDDDITVIMPSDQITGRPYDLRYRAQKLEDVYCVKVTSIDSAKKIVYVSHQEARMEKRPEIEAAIQQYLESNTPVIVTGMICAASGSLHLSISGTGRRRIRNPCAGKRHMAILSMSKCLNGLRGRTGCTIIPVPERNLCRIRGRARSCQRSIIKGIS